MIKQILISAAVAGVLIYVINNNQTLYTFFNSSSVV